MRNGAYETVERPSLSPIDQQQQQWPAGLLLSALLAGDIDRPRRAPAPRTSCRRAQQQRRRSTALSSKCGQCHADRVHKVTARKQRSGCISVVISRPRFRNSTALEFIEPKSRSRSSSPVFDAEHRVALRGLTITLRTNKIPTGLQQTDRCGNMTTLQEKAGTDSVRLQCDS